VKKLSLSVRMCLLQENTLSNQRATFTMAASGCKCIPSDPLGKNLDIIRKAEYEADINIKSKWNVKSRVNRVVNNGNNSSQNKRNSFRSKFDGNKTKYDGDKKTPASVPAVATKTMPEAAPSATSCAYRVAWKKNKRKNSNKKHVKSQGVDEVDTCSTGISSLDVMTSESDTSACSSSSSESLNSKKVHFSEDHLVQVIEFPDDEESEDMRKCYWEVFAVDRCRFKDRICQTENCLKSVLLPDHRQRIYNQRFIAEPSQ